MQHNVTRTHNRSSTNKQVVVATKGWLVHTLYKAFCSRPRAGSVLTDVAPGSLLLQTDNNKKNCSLKSDPLAPSACNPLEMQQGTQWEKRHSEAQACIHFDRSKWHQHAVRQTRQTQAVCQHHNIHQHIANVRLSKVVSTPFVLLQHRTTIPKNLHLRINFTTRKACCSAALTVLVVLKKPPKQLI